ncbi:MAG: hypothetical protein KDB27_12775, partial [Planctomycetales bacterium]|nr:hypothetical protein [Planctomycetales bacterium]
MLQRIRFFRLPLAALLLTACRADAVVWARSDESTEKPKQAEIESLVLQLGDEHYIRRDQARARLVELGSIAFDALYVGTLNDDTEIKLQSAAILRGIEIELLHQEDSAEVRRELLRFDSISGAAKLDVIDRLAAFSDDVGRAALCRIARYDRSEFFSKMAALAVFETERPMTPERALRLIQTIEKELGPSKRTASEWLRCYSKFLADPFSTVTLWDDIVQAEAELYLDTMNSTHRALLKDLLHWHYLVMAQLGEDDHSQAAIVRIVPQMIQQPVDVIHQLDWLRDHEAWAAIDKVAEEHKQVIDANTLMKYQLAGALRQQGQNEESEKLANDAFAMSSESGVREIVSRALLQRAEFDWFENELQS